jgi:hypothetical protein
MSQQVKVVAEFVRLREGSYDGFGLVVLEKTKDAAEIAELIRQGWYIDRQWAKYEPSTIVGTAFNGHKYEYNVIGLYDDGTARTEQWNARHQDDCACYTSDEGPWPQEDW